MRKGNSKCKIYDKKPVLIGLAIALFAFASPFWLSMLNGSYQYPDLATPAPAGSDCIESKEYMRAEHMTLLNTWRDMAVRENKRTYVSTSGKEWEISLQHTCHHCHANKEEFCDKCHSTNNVNPYCWNCHVAPKGNK